ncbi:MAG: hypothetical protein HC896_02810 [Bacteroidales bacterium]|nr:hypothetical protein [Bacteroidales bacterium]
MQYAEKYDYFNDNWVKFNEVLSEIPIAIDNKENYLKYRNSIEVTDSLYQYLLYIKEYKLVGDISPINLIEEDIKNIILSKRKVNFSKELMNNIYDDAQNKGAFDIYVE